MECYPLSFLSVKVYLLRRPRQPEKNTISRPWDLFPAGPYNFSGTRYPQNPPFRHVTEELLDGNSSLPDDFSLEAEIGFKTRRPLCPALPPIASR